MVKSFLVIPLVLLLAAQKPVKRPDVHPDFQFGSYPWSRTAESLMKEDLGREILVAYSQGWSVDKIAKTLKVSTNDVSRLSDMLEDEGLTGLVDSDTQALLPVIRERDFDRMKEPLRRHTQEFTKLITDNWKDIESMVDSLEGTKAVPKAASCMRPWCRAYCSGHDGRLLRRQDTDAATAPARKDESIFRMARRE
jgi:hypothetical protein